DAYRDMLRVAGGRERIIYFIEGLGLSAQRAQECIAEVPVIHRTKTSLYTHAVSEGEVALRCGVERLVDSARRAELRLGIVTTTSDTNVRALLSASPGLNADWFDSVVTGERSPRKKPAPDAYHDALRDLDIEPGDAVAIEDSRNGLLAATAAGIPVVITHCQWTAHEDFTGALMVLSSLGDPELPLLPGADRAFDWLGLADIEEALQDA
ncbi:MAG: HAD-IA family hydrolase, partial [Chromatocurvus sp.]